MRGKQYTDINEFSSTVRVIVGGRASGQGWAGDRVKVMAGTGMATVACAFVMFPRLKKMKIIFEGFRDSCIVIGLFRFL